MITLLRVCLLPLILIAGSVTADEPAMRSLVLVAHRPVPPPLALEDIRRAYLGLPSATGKPAPVPLINASDPLLYQVFLQKVIYMSARTYERRMLARVFRRGEQTPLRYEDDSALRAALADTPGSISFMWADQARDHGDITEVQELARITVDDSRRR